MAIPGIGGVGGIDLSQLAEMYRSSVSGGGGAEGAGGLATTAPGRAAEARSNDFADKLGDGISKLEGLDRTAQSKSMLAATGDLTDVHDYVIAATEMQTATELTTTVRNKALDAFNEIMRMPL